METVLFSHPLDRLKPLVKKWFKEVLDENGITPETESQKTESYFSRHEVSKMLNVSLVTLNKWNKSGRLPAHGIGRRVLYKQSDINNALVQI